MCVGSVCTHPSYNDKNPQSVFFFKSPFSNQSVLRALSEWRCSAQAAPTIVVLQDRLLLPACCKQSDHYCIDCFVIMNITVVIYSRHLSCWKRRGLTLLSFWRECSDPDLPKSVFVRVNHSWSSLTYRRSEYKGFYESLQIAFPNMY